MTGLLEGKVVLVTGGASGIGAAMAMVASREGAMVAIADINLRAAADVAFRIDAGSGNALAIEADVADQAQVGAMISTVMGRFGRLDCAFNNAGIARRSVPFGDEQDDDWAATIATNLTGVRFCMKHEIAQMRRQGGGAILNVSSTAGIRGIAMAGGYGAAKHGVVGITRSAALDHAQEQIRVNCICPGFIRTPLTAETIRSGRALDVAKLCPIGRVGEPEDVAEAAVWLCSDRASFVTGAVLPVDGGYAT